MAFKINIGTKDGKTYKLEADSPGLEGKELGQTIKGEEISPDLTGYEFKITGASDKSGFTALERVEGVGLKKVLLSYEKGMKKRPKKEGKKKRTNKTPSGLKLRKTVRGKVISNAISQINLVLEKEGAKKLSEVFPDQNAKPFENKPEGESAPEEKAPTETKASEETAKPEAEPTEPTRAQAETAEPDKEPQ
jgi:small subunit ribosomal protein S6e